MSKVGDWIETLFLPENIGEVEQAIEERDRTHLELLRYNIEERKLLIELLNLEIECEALRKKLKEAKPVIPEGEL